MESGESKHSITDDFANASQEYYIAEEDLFGAVLAFAQRPKSNKFTNVQKATDVLCDRFVDYTGVLLDDNRYSDQEKARSIATILAEADMKRVSTLKQITPEGNYEYSSSTVNDYTDMIESCLEDVSENEGEFEDDYVRNLIGSVYIGGLQVDANALVDTVNNSPQMYRMKRNLLLSTSLLEVGKLAIAGVIGGLVASKVMRQRKN